MSEGNPFTLMAAAAKGDADAQRTLALAAFEHVSLQARLAIDARQAGLDVALPVSTGIKLAEGLVFARLAASHGDADDKNLVLAMLSLTELFLAPEDATDPLAEMVARASLIADQGTIGADQFLDVSVAQSSPEIVALSQEYGRLIIESEAV